MSDKKTTLLLALTISILLSLHFMITPTIADDALIKRLCGVTTDPEKCEKCLTSGEGSKTADEIGLAEISMICALNDMDVLFETTVRLQESSTDTQMKGALGTCLDGIEKAKGKINGISDSVRSRDFKGAQGRIMADVSDNVNYCRLVIENMGLQVPEVVARELDDVNRDWEIFAAMLGAMN